MRSAATCASLALLTALLLSSGCGRSERQSAGTPAPARLRLAVPAYFAPDQGWTDLPAAAPAVGIAVINPASGPGSAPDTAYLSVVQRAQAAGIKVLGYVGTDHGRRPAEAVLADVRAYTDWYATDGIFFDEASTDCGLANSYYARLFNAVKATSRSRVVALNPGRATEECYTRIADVIVTFEGSFSAYATSYSAPSWTARYASERFWHLVYAAPTETELLEAVRLARQRRAGWLYVTPGTLPNPWDALPPTSYWSQERSAATLYPPPLSATTPNGWHWPLAVGKGAICGCKVRGGVEKHGVSCALHAPLHGVLRPNSPLVAQSAKSEAVQYVGARCTRPRRMTYVKVRTGLCHQSSR